MYLEMATFDKFMVLSKTEIGSLCNEIYQGTYYAIGNTYYRGLYRQAWETSERNEYFDAHENTDFGDLFTESLIMNCLRWLSIDMLEDCISNHDCFNQQVEEICVFRMKSEIAANSFPRRIEKLGSEIFTKSGESLFYNIVSSHSKSSKLWLNAINGNGLLRSDCDFRALVSDYVLKSDAALCEPIIGLQSESDFHEIEVYRLIL